MGYSSWSNDFYADRAAERAKTGKTAFEYHSSIVEGKAKREVHSKMDPKGALRESRDSDIHPESLAIGVILDETGSMHDTPMVMQRSLPKLMDQIKAGGVAHPQILFGAVGDYHSDAVALQVGQFESGIEMENDLGNIFMEGGGGGSYEESYQDAIYFFARHTSVDCWEKRKQKGYLFIIGDEKPYPRVTKEELKAIFGDNSQGNITVEEIVAEAKEKWDIYFVIPQGTQHGKDPVLQAVWGGLLGPDHVLLVNDPTQICEAIVAAVCRPGEVPAVVNSKNVRL
jgi:hypothetical protein